MTNRHIPRDYSSHRKNTYRPYDEFIGLEIYSFDPQYTREYIPLDSSLVSVSNCEYTSYRSASCYRSLDKANHMVVKADYNVHENGEYRIDILYEQSNHIWTGDDAKYNTGSDLIGYLKIIKDNNTVKENVYILIMSQKE